MWDETPTYLKILQSRILNVLPLKSMERAHGCHKDNAAINTLKRLEGKIYRFPNLLYRICPFLYNVMANFQCHDTIVDAN